MHNKSGAKLQNFSHIRKYARQIMYKKQRDSEKPLCSHCLFVYGLLPYFTCAPIALYALPSRMITS